VQRSSNGLGIDRVHAQLALENRGQVTLDLDWNHEGQEVRCFSLKTGRALWKIDIVAGRLYCDGELIREDATGFLPGEYQMLVRDFANKLGDRESFATAKEVAVIEAVERTTRLIEH
jgi:hypothetical protein